MVTESPIKTGYWRINPDTGAREWIEGSYQPKKPKLEEEVVEVEPIVPVEEIEPVRPEVPAIDVTDIARLYGLSAGRFVTPEQLADIALPPEERAVQWRIPFEQYLTGEQARYLGFDVPEGSVVLMTPMREGEPSFFLMPEPEAEAIEDERYQTWEKELLGHLRSTFPDMFDPAFSFGFSIEEIPGAVIESLRAQMVADYEGFVADLYSRVDQQEAETILRMLGVTEENILRTLDFKEQELRVNTLITDVLPDFKNLEEFGRLLETDFGLFVETVQTGGSTPEKRALLESMGYNPVEINQFFSVTRVFDTVDGIRQQLVIDVPSQKAYDQEGNWVGTYNVVTKEFTALPDEVWIKDVWDAFIFSGQHLYHQAKQFTVSSLPGFLFRDMGNIERKLYGDEWVDAVNAGNKRLRDEFRRVYTLNQNEFEDWVAKHPELAPPEWARQDIVTRLSTDPLRTILYEFASTAPFMIAVMGTTVTVALATGNPLLGITAGAAMATPPQAQEAYEALLAAGANEAQAGQLSLPIGLVMSAIETVGDLAYLRQVFPSVFRLFSKAITREVAKRTVTSLARKGLKTFGTIEITETLEEIFQGAVLNAGVRIFDENQEIFAGWEETALRTLAATAPLAVFGGAYTSLQRVSPGQTRGLSDAELKAKGFQKDPATGNWYEPMDLPDSVREEAGIPKKPKKLEIERPEVVPEVVPEVMMLDEFTGILTAVIAETKQEIKDTKAWLKKQKIREVEPATQREIGEERARVETLEDRLPTLEVMLRSPENYLPRLPTEFPNIQELLLDRGRELKLISAKPRKVAKPPPVEAPIPEAPLQKEALMPPPDTPTGRVAQQIQMKPAEPNFKEKIRQGWHKFNVKMVDDLFALKRVTDQVKKGGVELSIEENPYLLARLLRGITSKATTFLEKGTFGKVFWKLDKKGRAVPNFTGESLETMLKDVQQPEQWRDFSTYLTARRSIELSEREIETGIDVADAQASVKELETANPNFKKLAVRVYKYQDSLLVYGNEMGLISDDLLGNLREYGNYVPFYRVFNELQSKGLMGKKMANIAQPIKRIRGSEREIINPLESIVKNTYVLINAADRNMIGIALANLVDQNPEIAEVFERVTTPMARVARISAKELGVEVEGLTGEQEEQLVDIFRPSFFVRGDEVTVLVNGKKQYFRVDPDLRDALLNLDRESIGMMGTILGAPARWLRLGATLSPDFMARNPARDQMTAFCYSNYGFLPGLDFLRGMAGILRKDNDYLLYKMSGAEHSMIVSMDRQYLRKTFKEVVEGKGFTDYIKHPMELFRIASELGEKGTRMGEMKRGLDRGAVPLEVGYSTRVVSLDFSQMGTTARVINTLIAFFNANIRGWGRMVSSFKEHPTRTAFKIFVGITLPSMLLYIANRDDPRWKEIPQWQKDIFWIIFTKDTIYRIPKPFELGIIFGSLPERFLEWLDNRDPELFKEALLNLGEAGNPGWIPTAGLPVLEWLTNYSFFRQRAIVPASREKMPPELQYTQWTSAVSKRLGELLNLPPAKIDNFIYGWTGGLGRYAIDIMGAILKGAGISPDIPEPDPTLADTPVIKAFVVRNPYGSSGKTVNDFYKRLEDYTEGERYLKEMLELGEMGKFNKYKAAHPELLFFYDFEHDVAYSATARYLRLVARELTELRNKQDEVYISKILSSSEKRRLVDEIDNLKTDVAKKALALFFGEIPEVMQNRIDSAIERLGEVIEEPPILSLELPDIYDMAKLNQEFNTVLEGVTTEELQKLEGIDPLALAYLDKEKVEETVEPIINKKIYNIDPELKEGVTFEDYYQRWQKGWVEDSPLDKLTRRQIELLRQYHALDDEAKSDFREEHPELLVNPRVDWLTAHPEENAKLAVWGQAKIYSLEAYNAFKSMVRSLDIPEAAIPEFMLPPEASIKTHFAYEDFVSEGKHGSWEAQLLLAKEHQEAGVAGRKSYAEWRNLQISDTPIASLELKVDNRVLYDALEEAREIEKEEDREKAVEAIMLKVVEGETQFRDILRTVEIIEKGTETSPIDALLIENHVDYGRLADEHGASSAEVMLFRYDNPKYNEFRMDIELWAGQALEGIDEYRIPIWRVDVEYQAEDEAYNALPVEGDARENYLAENDDYRKARRTREAYELSGPEGERFPEPLIETYVQYYEMDTKGKRQERFLVENPEFAKAMHEIKGVDIPKPEDVPAVQYDDIYDQHQADFEKLEGLADNKSEHYIEDPDDRATARNAMRFDGKGRYTDFGLAEIRRNAYGAFVPEHYIEKYVGYYKIIGEGKPEHWKLNTGTDLWYDDDWFLIENIEFYREVYRDLLGNEKKDFTKVPSRAVFTQYLTYISLPHLKAKDDFRWNNREFDAWLVLKFGYTPIAEKKRREELTPYERFIEKWDERGQEIEEKLRELRGE